MAFDYKKEYKEFYLPKNKPQIVTIPKANFVAVRGEGSPKEEGGQYQNAMNILYSVSYTLKMSYKTDHKIEGYFEYVVPPLEGLWFNASYDNKDNFVWISMIRLPEFITKEEFDWAVDTASKKKGFDASKAEFLSFDEGLCVQIMHHGAYDDEPATVKLMHDFIAENNYVLDINDNRLHHEIYLSDPRRVSVDKLKTVIRLPIKAKD